MASFLSPIVWLAFVSIFFPPKITFSLSRKKRTKRAAESEPEPEPEAPAAVEKYATFISKAAAERFQQILPNKFLCERGFNLPLGGSFEQFRAVIKHYKWETFCQVKNYYMKNHVLEFYAKARSSTFSSVTVRGKDVDFSPEAINNLYGLNCTPTSCYFTEKNRFDLNEVIQAICKDPPSQISYTSSKRNFTLTKHLDRSAKVWNLFVCSSLLPISHISDISMDRLFLIYCIMQLKPLDVGCIIHNFLFDYLHSEKIGKIVFPCLISLLCRKVNVPVEDGEHPTTVRSDINKTVVLQYIKVRGERVPSPIRHRGPETSDLDLAGVNDSLREIVGQLRIEAEYSRRSFTRLSSLHDIDHGNLDKLYTQAGYDPTQFENYPPSGFDSAGYLIPTTSDFESPYYSYGEGLYYPPRQDDDDDEEDDDDDDAGDVLPETDTSGVGAARDE